MAPRMPHRDSLDGPLPEKLSRAGEAVGRLPRPAPREGLVERTLSRVYGAQGSSARAASAVKLKVIQHGRWWLRQITNPFARVAAMLALVAMLGLLGNLDVAERMGRLTERLIGAPTTDHVEELLDSIASSLGPVRLRASDLERLIGQDVPGYPRCTPFQGTRGGGPSASIENHQA